MLCVSNSSVCERFYESSLNLIQHICQRLMQSSLLSPQCRILHNFSVSAEATNPAVKSEIYRGEVYYFWPTAVTAIVQLQPRTVFYILRLGVRVGRGIRRRTFVIDNNRVSEDNANCCVLIFKLLKTETFGIRILQKVLHSGSD